MGLLRQVDTDRTEKNVKNYFEKEFPRLVLQAGYSMLDVQSPKFDVTGISSLSGDNSTENGMISHFEAQRLVKATVKAINRCPLIYRKILRAVYLNDQPDITTQMSLGYQHAQYNVKKKKAYLYFADSFIKIHDFHAYLKEDQIRDWKEYV